ncbi:MAG: late competence development ComFB family protein [Christensenellales bacterium]
MQPKNLMEELVIMRVDDYMTKASMCKCPQCRSDVIALALNRLPPRYVTCTKGNVFARFEAQTNQERAEISAAIIRAIEIVRKHPRHDE